MASFELEPLSTCLEEYGAQVLRFRSAGTQHGEVTRIQRIARLFGEQPDPDRVAAWLAEEVAGGRLMPATANNYLDSLSKCYALQTNLRGVPNLFRQVPRFPVQDKTPKAIEPPADGSGRYGKVRSWMAAQPDEIHAAFLFFLYDTGLRVSEALGLEIGAIDFARGMIEIRQQRDPDQTEARARLKTRGSKGWINVSAECAEWLARAVRSSARSRFAYPKAVERHDRYQAVRDRLAARFVFPFTRAGLERLMRHLRAMSPADFPRHERGARGGEAWHVFRHSLASDMADAYVAAGQPIDLVAIGQRLRHTHTDWTRTYIDQLRGVEKRTDLSPLLALREKQRAAAFERDGVTDVLAVRRARVEAEQAAAAAAKLAAGAAAAAAVGPGVGASTPVATGALETSSSLARLLGGAGSGRGAVVPESTAYSAGLYSGDKRKPSRSSDSRSLPLPPYPVTPAPARKRSTGKPARRGGRR